MRLKVPKLNGRFRKAVKLVQTAIDTTHQFHVVRESERQLGVTPIHIRKTASNQHVDMKRLLGSESDYDADVSIRGVVDPPVTEKMFPDAAGAEVTADSLLALPETLFVTLDTQPGTSPSKQRRVKSRPQSGQNDRRAKVPAGDARAGSGSMQALSIDKSSTMPRPSSTTICGVHFSKVQVLILLFVQLVIGIGSVVIGYNIWSVGGDNLGHYVRPLVQSTANHMAIKTGRSLDRAMLITEALADELRHGVRISATQTALDALIYELACPKGVGVSFQDASSILVAFHSPSPGPPGQQAGLFVEALQFNFSSGCAQPVISVRSGQAGKTINVYAYNSTANARVSRGGQVGAQGGLAPIVGFEDELFSVGNSDSEVAMWMPIKSNGGWRTRGLVFSTTSRSLHGLVSVSMNLANFRAFAQKVHCSSGLQQCSTCVHESQYSASILMAVSNSSSTLVASSNCTKLDETGLLAIKFGGDSGIETMPGTPFVTSSGLAGQSHWTQAFTRIHSSRSSPDWPDTSLYAYTLVDNSKLVRSLTAGVWYNLLVWFMVNVASVLVIFSVPSSKEGNGRNSYLGVAIYGLSTCALLTFTYMYFNFNTRQVVEQMGKNLQSQLHAMVVDLSQEVLSTGFLATSLLKSQINNTQLAVPILKTDPASVNTSASLILSQRRFFDSETLDDTPWAAEMFQVVLSVPSSTAVGTAGQAGVFGAFQFDRNDDLSLLAVKPPTSTDSCLAFYNATKSALSAASHFEVYPEITFDLPLSAVPQQICTSSAIDSVVPISSALASFQNNDGPGQSGVPTFLDARVTSQPTYIDPTYPGVSQYYTGASLATNLGHAHQANFGGYTNAILIGFDMGLFTAAFEHYMQYSGPLVNAAMAHFVVDSKNQTIATSCGHLNYNLQDQIAYRFGGTVLESGVVVGNNLDGTYNLTSDLGVNATRVAGNSLRVVIQLSGNSKSGLSTTTVNDTSMDEFIRESYRQITERFGDLNSFISRNKSVSVTIGSGQNQRIVDVREVYSVDGQARWISFMVHSRNDVFSDLDGGSDLMWLVSVGLIGFVLYITTLGTLQVNDSLVGSTKASMGQPGMRDVHGEKRIKLNTQDGIWKYFDMTFDRVRIASEVTSKSGEEPFARAKRYLDNSASGYRISQILHIEINYPTVLSLYYLYNKKLYQTLIKLVCFIHIGLAFFEAPVPNPDYGLIDKPQSAQHLAPFRLAVYICTAGVLLVYVLDLCLFLSVFGLRKVRTTGTPLRLEAVVRLMIVVAFWIDFVVQLCTKYTTGNSNAFLPYTAYLRPLLLLCRFPSSRVAITSFVNTLVRSGDVLMMFSAMLLVAIVSGSLLFQHQFDTPLTPGSIFKADKKFQDMLSSTMTAYIYLLGSENYPDLVYGVTTTGYTVTNFMNLIYFSFFSIVGTFLVVSTFIAVFEEKFTSQFVRTFRYRSKRRQRQAIIAAFCVVCDEKTSLVDVEFLNKYYKDISLRFDRTRLRLHEFVWFVEHMKLQRVVAADDAEVKRKQNSSNANMWTGYQGLVRSKVRMWLDSKAATKFMLLLVLYHFWILSMYSRLQIQYSVQVDGDEKMSRVLDILCLVNSIVFVVEVLLRIYGNGPRLFWSKRGDVYQEMANRYDLIIACMSCFSIVAFFSLDRQYPYPYFVENRTILRFCFAVGTLRVLSVLRSIRILFFGLIGYDRKRSQQSHSSRTLV